MSKYELESLLQRLDELKDYRRNLRSGPSFHLHEQDFMGRVKYRDFEAEEEDLIEKEVRLRIQIDACKREVRGLKDLPATSTGSGTRLDELYPTLPAPGAMLKFDPSNKAEGRWEHPIGSKNRGFRNLSQGVKSFRTNDGRVSWSLDMSNGTPAVMVRPDAISTLLPCEPAMIGDHTPYVKIMVNSVRRDSEILWAPVNDLVLV